MDDADGSAAKVWEIARAVLRYLETYPEAKDTLEGIAQWWLSLERTEQRLREVQQALTLLASKGLILETRREGVPTYYRLNPKRRDAIARILRG
jgi:DNA-binding transcriptional ArsR family regulator